MGTMSFLTMALLVGAPYLIALNSVLLLILLLRLGRTMKAVSTLSSDKWRMIRRLEEQTYIDGWKDAKQFYHEQCSDHIPLCSADPTKPIRSPSRKPLRKHI